MLKIDSIKVWKKVESEEDIEKTKGKLGELPSLKFKYKARNG